MNEILVKPDARPLYIQVKDILRKRIHSGIWSPGQALPSEMRLASELDVSQGTVRKALDALSDARIVERKQGRGTYVVEHTSTKVLFKFFHIYDNNGEKVEPGPGKTRFDLIKATPDIANSLSIAVSEEVYKINRLRTHKKKPFVVEQIYLPKNLFPGICERGELTATLYDMFQRVYGITVSRVQEDLTVVLATKGQAKMLDIAAGSPLQKIDRIAYDIEETPIERRIGYYAMSGLKYRTNLI
jgi:GntR family transcriptional regulator